MIRRCRQNYTERENYFDRGIRVCPEWADWKTGFGVFLEYLKKLGPRPSPRHSLDRINNDGNYEPGNIRWATPKEQQDNRIRATQLRNLSDAQILAELKRRKLILA
jgi:hypothetical protein